MFELVVTLAVLGVLIMGTIPLAQNAVKRQKEVRLRETLRDIRNAIDEFKRDTNGACFAGQFRSGNPGNGQGGAGSVPPDPRSRVVIDDCTIFDTENLDRFPPTLETLVKGVKIKQRGLNVNGGGVFAEDAKQATEINGTDDKIKVYLREMPIDPMTGESNWKFRSSYQTKEDENWDDINVFDVRSSSEEESLNGDKYSDW